MAAILTLSEQILLGLIAETPRHGYALEQIIKERNIRNWTELGFSSIYYLLTKLEAEGAVSSDLTASRKTYTITPKGIVALRDATKQTLLALTPHYSPVLVGLANSPLIDPATLIDLITKRKKAIAQQLQDVQETKQAQEPLPDHVEAIFNYSMRQLAVEAQWCNETINLLKKEETMDKVDFKKAMPKLYYPKNKDWQLVGVPTMNYLMVDGQGNPNTAKEYSEAVEALYSVSYPLKFTSKRTLSKDYTIPPLEGLWYSDDPSVFAKFEKDKYHWTMMIMQPEWITKDMVLEAIETAKRKKDLSALSKLRFESFEEGRSLQLLHIGSYDDEAPKLAHLHDEYMPNHKLTFNGHHHEIYLGDPRKSAPEKLKTILRQPVKAA